MDKKLRRIEKSTSEKLQAFLDSPLEKLNEGVPYEKRISFGEYGKYTIRELIIILSVEALTTDDNAIEKIAKLICTLKPLTETASTTYSSEQRRKIKEEIELKNNEILEIAPLVSSFIGQLILQPYTTTESENKRSI